MTARMPLPDFRRLLSSVSARWPCWSLPTFWRRLPNQPWGRKGLRLLRRSFSFPRRFLLLLSLRRARFVLFAISRRGPGPPLTGCGGAGASVRTSWDTGPAYLLAPRLNFSRSATTRGSRRPPIFPTTIATPTSPKTTARAILTSDGPTGA